MNMHPIIFIIQAETLISHNVMVMVIFAFHVEPKHCVRYTRVDKNWRSHQMEMNDMDHIYVIYAKHNLFRMANTHLIKRKISIWPHC